MPLIVADSSQVKAKEGELSDVSRDLEGIRVAAQKAVKNYEASVNSLRKEVGSGASDPLTRGRLEGILANFETVREDLLLIATHLQALDPKVPAPLPAQQFITDEPKPAETKKK